MGVKADFNPETFLLVSVFVSVEYSVSGQNILQIVVFLRPLSFPGQNLKLLLQNYEAPRKQYCESDMPCAPEYRRNHR